MTAAWYNTTPDITHVLLQHGGDAALSDDYGQTAVMLACCGFDRHLPVLQALMGHHTPVHLEARSSNGMTAVMCAVVNNSPGSLRLLLDMGASMDVRVNTGQTMMDIARDMGHIEVIRVLVEHLRRRGELLMHFCFLNGVLSVLLA